ncbi:MAG: tRNA threonylcarbamoyladenosine biosynthesis protein TsaE [Desulfobacteraceae bacterium Eth-SRB1]|nr:MAG: tRNA threonylcarbamoyladenosine biosynthesis protein TsaE [Desulfobacteraceae bacterium Eth-SRB1]
MISKQIQIITESLEETQALGRKIGMLLEAGTVVALSGDLGSGKTVFVQGLARGLDVPNEYYITSPTYTLLNEYPGRYTLFHVDLYRIENPVDLEDIGLYETIDSDGVVAVEWADKLQKDFLSEYIALHFEILGDESRKIVITGYGHERCDLIEKIQKIYEEKT